MKLTAIPKRLKQLIEPVVDLQTFIGEMPSLTDEGISIRMLEGNTNSRYFGETTPLYEPLYQIFIRTTNYLTGETTAQAIKDTLDGYSEPSLEALTIVGSPLYLGKSTQKLHEFQITFTAIIREE